MKVVKYVRRANSIWKSFLVNILNLQKKEKKLIVIDNKYVSTLYDRYEKLNKKVIDLIQICKCICVFICNESFRLSNKYKQLNTTQSFKMWF